MEMKFERSQDAGLLDTNAVSELVSLNPNQRVRSGSVKFGRAWRLWRKVRSGRGWRLGSKWICKRASPGRIVAIDTAPADRWGWMMARAKGMGVTLPVVDGPIAATEALAFL